MSVPNPIVAALLSVLLAGQPLYAAFAVTTPASGQMTSQTKTIHALNRLTFGPRPGDVARVQAMGLERWFEQQLNPATIDDAALNTRLEQYPAMQMSLGELQSRYKSPGELRQLMNGNGRLPSDPTERAMVQDQIAFYKLQKEKKADAVAEPGAGAAPTPAGMPMANAGKRGQATVQAGMDAVEDAAADTPTKPLTAADISADSIAAGSLAADGTLTREEAQRIAALAPGERMQAILALQPADLVRLRTLLRPREFMALGDGLTPIQRETLTALPGSVRMIALEAMESRLDRDIYSDRQLEAVMTDFWLNHFNVYVRKNQQEPYLLPVYERETIRPNALGNFETLLVATATSPAMQVYLDNFRSVGPDSLAAARIKQAQSRNPNGKTIQKASAGLNENYGRELMELQTLGVDGGYTQADVTNVAKVFTGWGLAGKQGPGQGGRRRGLMGGQVQQQSEGTGFVFNENRHEPGAKVVLGRTIKENGAQEGLEVLHMLATSPATAHFICGKLAVRFVSDTPPQELVDRMASAFLQSNGDIKTVLRTMFHSPSFWATENLNAKVKTPLEFVVSAARASRLEVSNPAPLVQALDKLGMPLYGMQTPQGYSWKKEEWVSTGALVSRLNFSLVLASDRVAGTRTDWTQLLGQHGGVKPAALTGDATVEKERRLEQILLNSAVSERTRATVLAQSGDDTAIDQAATQFDLGGGAKKQNYLPRGERKLQVSATPDDPQAAVMAGLLLGSPEFQRR